MRKSESTILKQLTSDEVLDSAYEWLCKRREDYPHNSEIWSFRFRWKEEKETIRGDLLAGRYCFSLLKRVTLKSGEEVDRPRGRKDRVRVNTVESPNSEKLRPDQASIALSVQRYNRTKGNHCNDPPLHC